jgi:hypothetical protein
VSKFYYFLASCWDFVIFDIFSQQVYYIILDTRVVTLWAKLNVFGQRRQKLKNFGRSETKVKMFSILATKSRIIGIILAKVKIFGITLAKLEIFVIIMRKLHIFGKPGGKSKFFWHNLGKI